MTSQLFTSQLFCGHLNIVLFPSDFPPLGASAGSNPLGQDLEVVNQAGPLDNPPKDYLALNIFALFCCFPLGIVGIIMATKCRQAAYDGDEREAYRKSISARDLGTAAVVLGIMGIVVIVGTAIRIFVLFT